MRVTLEKKNTNTLDREDVVETYTGEDGRYCFSGLKKGSYRLHIYDREEIKSLLSTLIWGEGRRKHIYHSASRVQQRGNKMGKQKIHNRRSHFMRLFFGKQSRNETDELQKESCSKIPSQRENLAIRIPWDSDLPLTVCKRNATMRRRGGKEGCS